ncbi:hypothetical protein BBO99_00002869 [Phytophthora kernoviae]|uniref:WW domain-containing protein n=2 Tax=Phytophthora kernoviae TaxID=325452 RepID=A0A3R7JWJ5_9STRA|nr:hypothetical protein G195_006567 [Phytophthora kernoviae 00238/432]KAG2527410.1 hypothetical protein JM18_003132 [Phytophthora kernoviae]RLN14284.1 hypothetical protein BBI17_002784 [Phytophthora kernoviae]RLN82492.1 hypothetical protein BBO99_00002869 [Phytophthora kernoviae]
MEEDEEEQIQPAATWDGDYRQEASEDETPASEWNKHSSETGETYYVNVVSGETSWENPDSPQQDQENDWVEAHTKEEPIDDKITYPYDAATEEIFNEDIAEEPGVLGLSLEQRPIQEVSLIESEFEAVCRREMIKEELLQLSGGDRFWGLDIHDSEVLQLHIEEELMAKGVSTISQQYPRMYTPQQEMLTANINLSDYLAFEEDDEKVDTERLQRELKEEFEAREAMFREEAQQCQNADSFWGIQAEESRQATANVAMALEEEASRRFAENALEQALSMAWEEEVQQSVANELATRGGQEQRMQERYLSWFYGQCISVDELLDYRWPTKLQQERLEETPSPVGSE